MSLFDEGDRVRVRGNSPATKMRGQAGVVTALLGKMGKNMLYELQLDSGTRYDAWEDEVEAAPSKKENKVNIKKEDEIKIDPETGLPELPEGYRWRVTDEILVMMSYGMEAIVSKDRLRVVLEFEVESKVNEEVENPDWRWWNLKFRNQVVTVTKTTWKRLSDEQTKGVSAEEVLRVSKLLFDRLDRQLKADSAREGLIGVYPPKKLEVTA